MNNLYYVYVLKSLKDYNFYTGRTNNLRRRFAEHNQGKNISTANRRPFELIFYEAFKSKQDAIKREKYLKTTKGKRTLKLMLQFG